MVPTSPIATGQEDSTWTVTRSLCLLAFTWWAAMMLITLYGWTEIMFKFRSVKKKPIDLDLSTTENDSPLLEGVTILRPIKGIDPELELCLESAILQQYPKHKLQILFCVENANDPAVPIVQRLISQYKQTKDVELLIDEDYVNNHFGPNPKINNLSKGFTRAKFDIIWVLDSNVWVNPGTLLRSVVSLKESLDNGRHTRTPVKLVHHVPLALSINDDNTWGNLGARLDEMFLFTSHAKFYVFFNKASIAPCVNGKSNIYRKSDLDEAMKDISKGNNKIINNDPNISKEAQKFTKSQGDGIKFFARYIGEDNMIGIALWNLGSRTGMTGDVAVQPIGGILSNSVKDYCNRRIRWLRVRKYMVLAATLVEPFTESLVVGTLGTVGISELIFGGKYRSWIFLIHELIWCLIDYIQFQTLITFADKDEVQKEESPFFFNAKDEKLKLMKWLPIWILREILALPIWICAMCGQEIDWRNRPFKIRADLTAEEL